MSMTDDRALAALVALAHGTRLGVLGLAASRAGRAARRARAQPRCRRQRFPVTSRLEGAGCFAPAGLGSGSSTLRQLRDPPRDRFARRRLYLLAQVPAACGDAGAGMFEEPIVAASTNARTAGSASSPRPSAWWRRSSAACASGRMVPYGGPLHHGVLVHVIHVVRQPGGDHRPLAHRHVLRDHAGAHAGIHRRPAARWSRLCCSAGGRARAYGH